MFEKWTSKKALRINRKFYRIFYYSGTIFIIVFFLISSFIKKDIAFLIGIITFPVGVIIILGWIAAFLIYLYKKNVEINKVSLKKNSEIYNSSTKQIMQTENLKINNTNLNKYSSKKMIKTVYIVLVAITFLFYALSQFLPFLFPETTKIIDIVFGYLLVLCLVLTFVIIYMLKIK